MNTSTEYIEACESGIAEALKTAAIAGEVLPQTHTLGLQAIRNSGYQSRKASNGNQHENINSACYILGSIHDQAIQDLMKVVNPSNPAEQRVAFLLQLSSFTTVKAGVTATMKRKVAEICDDILLAFNASAMTDHSVRLQSMLENCYGQLLQSKENEKKGRATIKALLESKARAEESRRRAEESRVNSEKLIKVLAAQLDLDEKSNSALMTMPTSMNDN